MKQKVDAGTIARTVILVLALVNQALVLFGLPVLPIESETMEAVVTGTLTIGAAVWAWWKNNSFTQAALQGDKIMRSMKRGD